MIVVTPAKRQRSTKTISEFVFVEQRAPKPRPFLTGRRAEATNNGIDATSPSKLPNPSLTFSNPYSKDKMRW
jgi:hypothetical protein